MTDENMERRQTSSGNPAIRLDKVEEQLKWAVSELISETGYKPTPGTPDSEGHINRRARESKEDLLKLIGSLQNEVDTRIINLNEDFEKKWELHEIILKGTNTTWGLVSRTKLLWSFLIPFWAGIGGLVALSIKEFIKLLFK